MFCRFCGKEIPEGGRFCPGCGKEADTSAAFQAQTTAGEIEEGTAETTAERMPAPVNSRTRKFNALRRSDACLDRNGSAVRKPQI